MPITEDDAREALRAQGITAPGPQLIRYVMDAHARREEELPAGARTFPFDYAALYADTPELFDRGRGPSTDPGHEASNVLADVLNGTRDYFAEQDDAA